MKATTTRTLNPLPFQDLEPHRFEDLVRQLAYDMRSWKSLEATGRSGSDEGIDIRATEMVSLYDGGEEDDGDGAPEPRVVSERLWIFQCKRERTLAAKRVREVVKESLASLETSPHGFVLAVACDVSKKTRDAFREEMVARGVEEFGLWARGELEDMLFQPKNDRLLFAYFGISLTARRRAVSTSIRSTIARKKQLSSLLGDAGHPLGRVVLLRDPTDERYPDSPKASDPPARWLACRAVALNCPGHLMVIHREYLAATSPDRQTWDAILDYDVEERDVENELRGMHAWAVEERERSERTPRDFWNEYIADPDRAWLKVYRFVPLDRVVAIDPLGDGYYPIPHVFVEFIPSSGPFSDREFTVLEPADMRRGRIDLRPEKANRTEIFPQDLPGENDPVPARFDDTSSQVSTLSEAADAKLRALFTAIDEGRKPAPDEQDETSRLETALLRTRPFKEWRERVALPHLSALVSQLRAAGHTARVIVRSVEPTTMGHEVSDSIELRVRMHIGRQHDPARGRPGHLRVSMSEYAGWRLDVSPSREESGNRHGSAPRTTIESMPAEQLEIEVVGMLERLRARGY